MAHSRAMSQLPIATRVGASESENRLARGEWINYASPSGWVQGFKFDPETQSLVIAFKGGKFRYPSLGWAAALDLLAAANVSAGKWVHANAYGLDYVPWVSG